MRLSESAGGVTIVAADRASLAAEDNGGAAIALELSVAPPAEWPPNTTTP